MKTIEQQIKEHALRVAPEECCGLVVLFKGRKKYVECTNTYPTPTTHFRISASDYYAASKLGEIVAVVHSHPTTPAMPSEVDKASQARDDVEWIIYRVVDDEFHTFGGGEFPSLYGRPYIHGVQDCYTFVRDWYKQELGILLPDYEREDEWWYKGQNLYVDNYKDAGFYEVDAPEYGDMIVMALGGSVANHGAVYVGGDRVGHHPTGRLSSIDVYGDFLRERTHMILRHKDVKKG